MRALVPIAGAAAIFLLAVGIPAARPDGGPPLGADAGGEDDLTLDQDAGVGEGMGEVLDEAMRKIAVARSAEARQMFRKKDYPGALARYREAYDLDPRNPEITNNLGFIYYLLGNPEEAERLYRWAIALDPERFVAYMNLADLLREHLPTVERLDEAAALLVRARELKGNQPKVIIQQARVAAARGETDEAERFYNEYLGQRKPSEKLCLELGDFYRDLGRPEEALEWYRQINGEELGRQAAARIWEIEVEKQTRKFGWTTSPAVIPGRARMLASKGRVALLRGDHGEAERLLGEALALAPGFAMARADQGDLYSRTGRVADAELAYLRAAAIDHSNAEILARLGKLYGSPDDDGETRDAMASIFLARAVELRPDWTELHLELALALRGAGDLIGALAHVNTYLESTHRTENRGVALSLKRAVEALIPPEALAEPGLMGDPAQAQQGMSEALARAMASARVHLSRGETDAAMAELRSLGPEDRDAYVLNLEARILLGAGRLADAAKALRESLGVDEGQGIIHEQLGSALVELGDERAGRVHLERAEELGDLEAIFHLARLDAGETRPGFVSWASDARRLPELLRARTRLARFLEAGSVSVLRKDAELLEESVEERIAIVLLAAGVALLLLVAATAAIRFRLWGGADLRRLIEKHPETGPGVQRVLSAVRHEVLKHNTMMLAGLVTSMEQGDDVAEQAAHFARSIAGPGEGQSVGERLGRYVGELERLGHANRERLNLRRKDAAIAPLLRGIGILDRRARDLSRYGRLPEGRRAALLRSLTEASRLLNTEGYEAVRELLDRLRVMVVDENLLLAIYDRCTREPAFSGVRFAPLHMDLSAPTPLGIPMPRAAFEDILTNLLRNAIQSTIQHGAPGEDVVVGLGVGLEADPVTGLERAVMAVRDRSREELTAEMLRGRYIEEGLGLTADLVSRYDGTLDVVGGDRGWSKAVLLKLPVVELDPRGGD